MSTVASAKLLSKVIVAGIAAAKFLGFYKELCIYNQDNMFNVKEEKV